MRIPQKQTFRKIEISRTLRTGHYPEQVLVDQIYRTERIWLTTRSMVHYLRMT